MKEELLLAKAQKQLQVSIVGLEITNLIVVLIHFKLQQQQQHDSAR